MKRRLYMRHGTEGPRHDPYGFTEYELVEGGRTITLHLGLLERCTITLRGVTIGGRSVVEGDEAGPTFEREAGMSVARFERAWHRLNLGYEETRAMERRAGWSCEP